MTSWRFVVVALLLVFVLTGAEAKGRGVFLSKASSLSADGVKRGITQVVGGILVAIFATCGGITGCGYGTTKSVVDVLGEKDANDLIVLVDGVWYRGYLGGALGGLVADVADDSGPITFVQRNSGFGGEAITDHEHIGADVYFDAEDFRWYGMVSNVFTNNWYEIEISDWRYTGAGEDRPPPLLSRFVLVHEHDNEIVFSTESETGGTED